MAEDNFSVHVNCAEECYLYWILALFLVFYVNLYIEFNDQGDNFIILLLEELFKSTIVSLGFFQRQMRSCRNQVNLS